jgi:hypothetical protein
MKGWFVLLILGALTIAQSCTSHVAAPIAPPPRPPPVVSCPAAPAAPPAPPHVVSVERLGAAYHALDLARLAERKRGDACAAAVSDLKQWIAN